MIRAVFLCLVWLLISNSVIGQTIRIVDEDSGDPLIGVTIYHDGQSIYAISDINGFADLSEFDTSTTVLFNLIGYEKLSLTFEQISGQDLMITMKIHGHTLDEVVISASKWMQYSTEVANKIQTLDAEQIININPSTTADLISNMGGVYVQKSQMGGGSPMIRGFAANRVLIVVDDIRMNNAIFRSGNLQNIISIDPNSIEHSEVIFGPGSLLYGSDALGGVMNIHTFQPKLSHNGDANILGNAFVKYGTAGKEKSLHLDFNYGTHKFGSITSFTYSDFGDQIMGSFGPDDYLRNSYVDRLNGMDSIVVNDNPKSQKFSGYNQFNLMQKFRYKPNEGLNIIYGFQISGTSDIPRYDRLILTGDSLPVSSEWYYGPQNWMMHSLSIDYTRNHSLYDKLKISAAYQYFKESRHDRNYQDNWLMNRTESVNAFSVNLDFNKTSGPKTTINYGFEGIFNRIGSKAIANNIESNDTKSISTRYPDNSKWGSYAGYIILKKVFNNRLVFTTGVRYNQIVIQADADTTFYPFNETSLNINTGAFTGSAGLVYKPGKDWQFNFNLSSGFRAPNIDDVAKVFDSEPGSVIIPNPNLQSEYAYNADIGIIKQVNKSLQFEITGFYTLLDNAIDRRPSTLNGQDSIIYDGQLSQVFSLQNLDGAVIYGIQFGAKSTFGKAWNMRIHLNYTNGNTSDNEPVRHVAPFFGEIGINYHSGKFNLDISSLFNGELPYSRLAPSEQNKPHLYTRDDNGLPYSPSWITFNFIGTYNINSHLSVNLSVENITDVRYRTYSSGIASPGRNLSMIIRGKI